MSGQAALAERIGGPASMSKIERYQWASLNSPGEQMRINKHMLTVDHSYQRDFNQDKARRIAADFSWIAFGALIAVRRQDGVLALTDGQHRLGGAMLRSDVTDVPCVVFSLSGGIEEEARWFLGINVERKSLSGLEKFKAQVVSGNPTALAVESLVSSSGHTIGPRRIECPTILMKCMATEGSVLQRVWPLVVELCEGDSIHADLIEALFVLERRLVNDEGVTQSIVTDRRLREKLVTAGPSAIKRSMGESAAYHAKGGGTIWARGILRVLNFKLQRRLALRGDKGDD